jgi:hypothetical protein
MLRATCLCGTVRDASSGPVRCASRRRERLGLAFGTLDDDPGIGPDRDIQVASRASCYAVEDGLAQFAADAAGGNG